MNQVSPARIIKEIVILAVVVLLAWGATHASTMSNISESSINYQKNTRISYGTKQKIDFERKYVRIMQDSVFHVYTCGKWNQNRSFTIYNINAAQKEGRACSTCCRGE